MQWDDWEEAQRMIDADFALGDRLPVAVESAVMLLRFEGLTDGLEASYRQQKALPSSVRFSPSVWASADADMLWPWSTSWICRR